MKNYGADSETVGQPRRRAFTLIELLVVLTIIGLLAGLIMPAVSSALGSGKGAGCTSNVRQIALALVAFDGDMGYMPWLNNGPWTPQKDSTGAPTNSTRNSTNWCDALIKYNYISVTAKDKGVWRCPGASSSEIYGKDTSGNPANFGGYGVEWHVFRDENSQDSKTFDNIPNPKLKMARVTRPSTLWLVGDCGRPVTQSAKGSGRYQRTSSSYGYPSAVGQWDFTKSYTDPSPALRHNGEARYAAFDTHVVPLPLINMMGETNDFAGRKGGY